MAAFVVLVSMGAATPRPPSITFSLAPSFVGCTRDEPPVKVRASWRITHPVSSATISGAVDASGLDLPPIALSTKVGKHGITGSRTLRLRCASTAQTLVLTAVGPGGTTKSVATLNENRAD